MAEEINTNAELLQIYDRMGADAARYRWIRTHMQEFLKVNPLGDRHPDQLDAMVDHARR